MTAVPTTPKGKRTRSQILGAARRVFARDGYVGATMSAIAEETGVSLGGLYRYFTNKEDVFESLIGDIHDELYRVSGTTEHDFGSAPFDALFDANLGYLEHYYANRDVMRALIEAANVDARFRDFWFKMRNRHIDRFVSSLQALHGISRSGGLPARHVAEAAACMVEQSAYVWYAHEDLRDASETVPVSDAAMIVTRAWHGLFFPGERGSA
ncbi:TetR family transcriptional regulator [Tamaricihabitans halophyticus]|uniref:TetR family transcriptional regulator n=1 Tax=Tamaricihabitans halophyticus TaxID=1262583 RepID=A0A4V2SSR1_9PSEU|nr:TetR/AcrR family transcriptional regulator [Tamaricihabitans halophyticus]TCP47876.1 TetR family transcriptional regulator [Tamaricihabitans halophyticus]